MFLFVAAVGLAFLYLAMVFPVHKSTRSHHPCLASCSCKHWNLCTQMNQLTNFDPQLIPVLLQLPLYPNQLGHL